MPVTFTVNQRALTAVLSGELDHHGARGMMDELDRAIGERLPLRLELDLAAVTFMDSSGLALLIQARRQMERLGGRLRVVNVPPQPRRVLEAAGAGRLVDIEPAEKSN